MLMMLYQQKNCMDKSVCLAFIEQLFLFDYFLISHFCST
ncbi:hypothetical protein AS4_00160 [Acinetobacter guillouiae]|nr:hypothetical protein AS4_00160 [Acinetobacter guillouiae]